MNVIIVHGSNPRDKYKLDSKEYTPQNIKNWIFWIKKKLEEKEIRCFAPLMPKSWEPTYEEWKKEFEKPPIDENSILIGTSAGGAFLVRWLGETEQKIRKLILVAPAKTAREGDDFLKELYNFEINKNIINNIKEIILFESTNDHERILNAGKIYSKELGVNPRILENKGHFTEKGMGTEEFPELLEEVLKTFK